jgi:uncharacterized secreted protein with C-terminal beta-propeller domain
MRSFGVIFFIWRIILSAFLILFMKKTFLPLLVLFSLVISSFGIQPAMKIALVKAQTAPSIFSDVTVDRTDSTAIQKLQTDGIIQGYADGTYKPDQEMNRAEFMKLLMAPIVGPTPADLAAALQNPAMQNCFDDVHTEWFAPYICAAKAKGIVSGVGTGKVFNPADKIKFSEASKIITNAYNLSKGQPDAKLWFKQFVDALAAKKDIPLTVEYFDQNVKRGETAEMVWRIHDNVTDKASRNFAEINGDGLVTASSCVDFQNRYADGMKGSGGIYGGGYGVPMMLQDAVKSAEMAPTAAPAPADSSGSTVGSVDHSTTNVQVVGVDEADIVKNDGKYIYTVKGQTVRIVDAYPASPMKELASIVVDSSGNFYPKEMYLSGNNLVIVGSSGGMMYPMTKTIEPVDQGIMAPSMMPYYRSSNRTKVVIVDVTDHSKPVIGRTVEFDGNYNTSRRIGSTVYMVMNDYPSFPYYYQQERTESELNPESFLPKMTDSKNGKEELIVPCSGIRIFPKPSSYNFLITAAIPLDSATKDVQREVVVGSVDNVYASTGNLYVAATDWRGGYYNGGTQMTGLYKFALGDGTIKFVASGSVKGTVLNQFSMDEEASGNVRIATTQTEYNAGPLPMMAPATDVSVSGGVMIAPIAPMEPKTSNNVFVLNSAMKQIGAVSNIAPGESIFSARFVGNRGYLVTFKQIDPLFVIDLSVPTAPKILGELKIPGYSNYLHPYDATHLIGFGKMVDESIDADKVHSPSAVYYTAVQGMKLGLFDVTNVNQPKEMFTQVIGARGTDSELLSDHRALLFDKAKGLLAFPISVYEGTGDSSSLAFQGAYVYKVGLTDGFKLQGKIAHPDDIVRRLLYIGENLYTVSGTMVKANALSDLHDVGSLLLQDLGGDLPKPMPL